MSSGNVLVFVSPAVAILIALLGFRRSTKADRLEAFFKLQEQYLKPEVRAGRKLLHEKFSGRSPEEMPDLTDDERDRVGHALATMNSIAIACAAKYVDVQVVQRSMGRSFVAAMTAAEPYIDELERRRGFRPYGYASRLAASLSGPSDQRSRLSRLVRRGPQLTQDSESKSVAPTP
jgi:hypothetical protein